MISAIEGLLGKYVQLSGDGIATWNFEWLFGALLVIMSLWFIYRVFLKFLDWFLK